MGFKEEFKREMRNVKNDVAKEVDKNWAIGFEGHKIEIYNKMMEETVTVDGQLIASHTRHSMWSHILPYSTLSGTFSASSGKQHKLHVKIGGFLKLTITVKVDGKILLKEAVTLEFLPWSNKETIVSFLEQQVQEHQKIINKVLPDEHYFMDENHLTLAPGLSDQIHVEVVTPFYTKKLIKLFTEQVENPTNQTRKATYEKIKDEKVINYFHELVELFTQVQRDEARVQQEALWLLENGAHREVVKFALVILGCTNCEVYKERLKSIALHEEFTGVAFFALKNGAKNANESIWQITKAVTGWGKIEAVSFLEPDTEEIRYWFITEGVKNDDMNEYSAQICAEKGQLDVLLHESEITTPLFVGAGEIINGILPEMGHQTADDYDYTGQVFMRYTHHAKKHCEDLAQFYILTRIAHYMDASEEEWQERYDTNWKPHERNATVAAIEEIAKNQAWLQEALEMLHTEQEDPTYALGIAQYYKADITELLFEKLKKEPNNAYYHQAILEQKNPQAVQRLVELAARFDSIENLTDEERLTLSMLVESLRNFEGMGISLIEKCLRSDEITFQYFALLALAEQKKELWQQPSMKEAIKAVASNSIDKNNRQFAKGLL